MKLVYASFIVLLVLSQNALGQTTFGVKAGVNVANQYKKLSSQAGIENEKQSTKALLGYQVGVFGKKAISNTLSVAGEVNFSLIGSKTAYLTEDQILNPDGKQHYYNDQLGYIEVPVTLQYNLHKLYFGVGPGIGIKVFSKITNFEGNQSYTTPFYKTVDVAANGLAGYQISKKIDVNLRYSHGLLGIYEANDYFKVKNRFFNFSLLYKFK